MTVTEPKSNFELTTDTTYLALMPISYRKTSNIRRTLGGNKIVDNSDVACRRCSNYIFILDLTSGFKEFGKDSRKKVRESFRYWDLVRLILQTWW